MYIYSGKEVGLEELIGGKAYKLSMLSKYNVPNWFCVSTNAFFDHLSEDISGKPYEEIDKYIQNLEIRKELVEEINQAIKSFDSNDYLAVRSSAIGEDGDNFSFAGQMDSFLYVKPNDIIHYMKKVWLSAYNTSITTYRQQNNVEFRGVAVIVQKMVNSDSSGVAFGINPVSGNKNEILISSVYGQGEGLVSGELDADSFRVLKNYTKSGELTFEKESDIISKKIMYEFDNQKGFGIKSSEVEFEKQNEASIKQEEIEAISHSVEKLNNQFNYPQDVEWAIEKGELFILQTRPITSLQSLLDKTEKKQIWDNSNIVESYSGVSLPLTFSFISYIYSAVYKEFCRVMGVEEKIIESNSEIFAMLGLIKGKVYYNLYNWYQVLSLLPGYSINAGFMEQMMGVKEKMELSPNTVQSKKNPYLRVVKLVGKLIINFKGLSKSIVDFYKVTEEKLKPVNSNYLKSRSSNQLKNDFVNLEKSLLKKWQAPLINDFFAMIFYGIMKKLIVKWEIDSAGTLQNDLLCGEGGIISTAPIKSLRTISNYIISDKYLKQLFTDNNPENILSILDSANEITNEESKSSSYVKKISEMIKEHIENYGDRCVNELKLETITPKHEPVMIIRLVKSYIKLGVHDFEAERVREQKIRKEAETKLKNKISNPIKRGFFNYILRQSRRLVKNRENLRFERTRLYSKVREIFLAIGHNFQIESVISNKRDIFYLSKEEIFDFIEGTSIDTDLKNIISNRKIQYQRYENERTADRFSTYGIVYSRNKYISDESNDITGDLEGIGCCPGLVKAPVRLVTDPNNAPDLEGCILVAEKTDPGWVPLFPLAKAIIVERGSLLSHSAIVAREMGIPAIVSVSNLMDKLVDGELVEMDGSSGKIKLYREETNE